MLNFIINNSPNILLTFLMSFSGGFLFENINSYAGNVIGALATTITVHLIKKAYKKYKEWRNQK